MQSQQKQPKQKRSGAPKETGEAPRKEMIVKQVKALAIQKGRTSAQQRYFNRARTRYHFQMPHVRNRLQAAAQVVLELLAANDGVIATERLEEATSSLAPLGLAEIKRDLGLIAVKLGKTWYTVNVEPPEETVPVSILIHAVSE